LQPEKFQFETAFDLASYLSERDDEWNFARCVIEKKLAADEQFRRIKKRCAPLRDFPVFCAYRKKKYKAINSSLQRAAKGEQLTIKEQQPIDRLRREIAQSPILLSAQQVVFYGLGHDGSMMGTTCYSVPHFLSTTLCMTVAISHALRKSGVPPKWEVGLTPVVMAITLDAQRPAIFACGRRPAEYELLFDCGAQLSIERVSNWPNGKFEFVEATLHSSISRSLSNDT